jgi:uncharacterized protein involved in response to NO
MASNIGAPHEGGLTWLKLGFRPFYLLAGIYAALAVPLWALQYAGIVPGANLLWHAHEMLFGYAFAAVAGFLLTAVRAWTGRPTASGWPLGALAALWIAARVLALYSLSWSVLADALFALALAVAIGRPLVASGNRRNWFFIALVLGIGAAGVLFQARPALALTAALDLVLFAMAVVAGRVIPMFTNNAVPGAGARSFPALEGAALGAILLLLVLDLAELRLDAGAAAIVAAGVHGARLALWRPLAARGRPILWILHLSYAWIVIHLALRALGAFDLVASPLATHALTVGAIGGLTLGMMTRTARGHTGRPLQAGRAEIAAYLLVQLAALVRVALPLVVPSAYFVSAAASATLWTAAFALFVFTYYPVLTQRRLDGKDG